MLPGRAPCGISGHRLYTALFQPSVQRCKIGEARAWAATTGAERPDVLLDLAFLPSRCRIAELWFKHIVVRHCQKAHVDLSFLTATDTVNCGAHIVVDAAPRNAAKDAEPVPVGIEQHLMRLQQIGSDQESPAVRQLDVGDLQLGAFAAQNGKILAPVELECFAWAERQWHEGAAPRRLLLLLPIGPPISGKSRHPTVGPGKAENHQIGMQLLQRTPLLARLACLRLQPAGQLLCKRIKLALPFWRRELRLDRSRVQILL